MKKRILLVFICMISMFIFSEVSAAEPVCQKSTVTQDRVGDKASTRGEVYMYLYTKSDGTHVYKTGYFWDQRVTESGEPAFCVDMNKNSGSNYTISDEAYKEWISNVPGFDSTKKDLYAIKILVLREAVKDQYEKLEYQISKQPGDNTRLYNRYANILNATSSDEKMMNDIAYIISQVSSWALSEGEPDQLFKSRVLIDGVFRDQLRIVVAQAYCSLYVPHGNFAHDVPNECTYNPGKKFNEQSELFLRTYNLMSGNDDVVSIYDFVRNIWDSMGDNNGIEGSYGGLFQYYPNEPYSNYVNAWRYGLRRPTLFIPEKNTQQRLLSDYYCNYVDTSSGCWYLNVDVPNLCQTSSNSGFVSDMTDWNCILNSYHSRSQTIKDHYISGKNSYCTIFCREEVSFELPNLGAETFQGSYLTVENKYNSSSNNIRPLHFKGKKECKPGSLHNGNITGVINWTKYLDDAKRVDEKLVRDWDAYKIAQITLEAHRNRPFETDTNKLENYNSSSGASPTVNGYYPTNTCARSLIKDPAKVTACETETEVTLTSAEIQSAYKKYVDEYNESLGEDEEKLTIAALEDSVKEMLENEKYEEKLERAIDLCINRLPKDFCPYANGVSRNYWSDYEQARYFSSFYYANGEYDVTLPAYIDYEDYTNSKTDVYDRYTVSYDETVSWKACTLYGMNDAESHSDCAVTTGSFQDREDLYDEITSCTTSAMTINYDSFKPQLYMDYEEDVYGYGLDDSLLRWTLVEDTSRTPAPDIIQKTFYSTDNPYGSTDNSIDGDVYSSEGSSTKQATWSNCVGRNAYAKCTAGEKEFTTANWFYSSITVEKYYTLKNNIYRYVEKGTGQSVHSKDSGIEYIDVGIGNLPIHYSATPNTVFTSSLTSSFGASVRESYDFNIYTTTFGTGSIASKVNKFNKYIFNKNKFNGQIYYKDYTTDAAGYKYECQYKVNCNPLIADNEACPGAPSTGDGLNLVYRTVSLLDKKNAFPGNDGDGRTPGTNWNDSEAIKKITLNRGVQNYKLYTDLDPLYEIELTPRIIQALRSYNKQKNSDYTIIYKNTSKEKSGVLGYTNFDDFDCNNGSECKSKLIRGEVIDGVEVTGCAVAGANRGYRCQTRAGYADVAW